MASKNASENDNALEHNINGSIPKKEKITHTNAVSKKPSRFPISVRRGCRQNVIAAPVAEVTPIDMAKANQSVSS